MEGSDTTFVNDNENLHSENSWNFSVTGLLENYGWYLLLVAVVVGYAYRKAQPTIDAYFKEKADREYAAKYHKNPDIVAARLAAQQVVAQKLQERYVQDALQYQQKMEEKEARKREDWLARQQSSSGHKLGDKSTRNGKNSLKPEHHPLMGDNSRSYRPQRKSPCSGGGCGK